MRAIIISLAILAFSPGGLAAQNIEIQGRKMRAPQFSPPVVTIGGNNGPVDYGEMVILTADFDTNKLPNGLVSLDFNWTVLDDGKPKKVFVADGGREIAFAVGMKPKRIMVILDVNCLFETKDDKGAITDAKAISPSPIFSEIAVGTGPPAPNPLPSPPIVLPTGQFGLAKFMFDTFNGDTNLDKATRLALAGKLASSLEGVASKIVSVADYKDMATILADTKNGNDAAFSGITGLDLTRAEPLKVAIRTKIAQLYKEQKINTAADLAIAWREMSQGLRALR